MLSITQRSPKQKGSETSSLRKLGWAVKAALDMNERGRKMTYAMGVSGMRGDREATTPAETQFPKYLNR